MKKLVKRGITAGLLLPAFALAQGGIAPSPPISGAGTDLFTIIQTIVNWLTGFLILLAVLFIIWAAFIYLTAAGDTEKVGKANKVLIYAAVAIAVALLSQGIVFIVANLFQAGTGTQL